MANIQQSCNAAKVLKTVLHATIFLAATTMLHPLAARPNPTDDRALITDALEKGCKAFEAGDLAGSQALFYPAESGWVDLDITPPRVKNYASLARDNAAFANMTAGKVICQYLEIHPTLLGANAAYSWAVMRFAATFKDGRSVDVTFRSTDVWRKIKNKWLVVHEHNSFPVDIFTGAADLQSKP
jgi:ketosteroid isomerase-like protein